MENVRVRIPATSSGNLVIGHLSFGDMIHRAAVMCDAKVTPATSLVFTLYQYRNGALIGSAIASLTVPSTGLPGVTALSANYPYELNPPLTPDNVQVFDDPDALILNFQQNGAAQTFNAVVAWM